MAFAIMLAIVIAFSIGRELILSKQSGWERLSKKYPCKAPFQGRYKGCYWAQFTTVAEKHKTVVTIWPHESSADSISLPAILDWCRFRRTVPEKKCVEFSPSAAADSVGQNSGRRRDYLRAVGPKHQPGAGHDEAEGYESVAGSCWHGWRSAPRTEAIRAIHINSGPIGSIRRGAPFSEHQTETPAI